MRGNERGFSLIELIVAMVIIGILSYVVVAKFGQTPERVQFASIAQKIVGDVRYAREMAYSTHVGTRVYMDVQNNRYYLKWETGAYLTNPLGGGDFVVQLGQGNFYAVKLTGTSLTGGRLDFDGSGKPLNSGAPFSGTLTLVTLNNTKRVVVTANTGLLRIEDIQE
ncbi:MAG: prepilin-type N-terminal cleavage/methylation domain-containing protein [Calditrichaeota bacterium]|nr:MAG: prepilin-type N-terminal cleavage/methylation domain-containing protein [Calditrichota bacterium]